VDEFLNPGLLHFEIIPTNADTHTTLIQKEKHENLNYNLLFFFFFLFIGSVRANFSKNISKFSQIYTRNKFQKIPNFFLEKKTKFVGKTDTGL
jgi:hypothetical protein